MVVVELLGNTGFQNMVGWELELQNSSFTFQRMYKQFVCLADSHWDKIIYDFFQIFGNHLDSQQEHPKERSLSGKASCDRCLVTISFFLLFSMWSANLVCLPCAHCTTFSLLSRPVEKVRWKSSSVVGLHGLQGESLLHRGLLHGLRGHLCSGAWSTSSPFLTDLQGCFTMFLLLPHCCCATLFTNS